MTNESRKRISAKNVTLEKVYGGHKLVITLNPTRIRSPFFFCSLPSRLHLETIVLQNNRSEFSANRKLNSSSAYNQTRQSMKTRFACVRTIRFRSQHRNLWKIDLIHFFFFRQRLDRWCVYQSTKDARSAWSTDKVANKSTRTRIQIIRFLFFFWLQ